MKKLVKPLIILLSFITLSILSQIGGIVLLISLGLSRFNSLKFRFNKLLFFLAIYLLSTFLIIPLLAPIFGRERVIHTNSIKPTNYMTVLLNRNYVRPEMNRLLLSTANMLDQEGIQLNYLDANFPFIKNFPLLPHLSHKDGKKLDISLVYETKEGKLVKLTKSVSGYGVFENPKGEEFNQIEECLSKGYFQYDYPKYLTFGHINNELSFSERGSKSLILALLENKSIEKIFIEPHLKSRLQIEDNRLRYHGCKAVRHDDHIHIQIK